MENVYILNQQKKDEGSSTESQIYSKFSGRRIVEMDKLASDLWCPNCDDALSLRFLLKEKLVGVCSHLLIKCQKCEKIVEINTSKKSRKFEDSNLKLTTGKMFLKFIL